MMGKVVALVTVGLLAGTVAAEAAFSPSLLDVSECKLLATAPKSNSSLCALLAPGQNYQTHALVINLRGDTRYQQGFDYGYLLSDHIFEVYNTFLASLLGTGVVADAIKLALGEALDWQWNDYLSQELPADFVQEIEGISAGAEAAGAKHLVKAGTLITRTIALANLPGDLKDVVYILLREFKGPEWMLGNNLPVLEKPARSGHCSMFAAWGSRTETAKLFAGRNLDWNKDSGINSYKLVAVHHPPGKAAHATFGFVGLYGALAGMSEHGITVHEANLEENEITFGGFPWLLRLRYIMENAKTCTEAKELWKATNNTVGFNHMVSCAADAAQVHANPKTYAGPGPAVAMETMFNYTAYFTANDPREANMMYNNTIHLGAPTTEAVWRTNHGYDPLIRKHFEWSLTPSAWSVERYFFIEKAIKEYAVVGKPIGLLETANITAIVGDKGKHAYQCQNNTDGSNILSVAFAPTDLHVAVAWESGAKDSWRPACCSSYLKLDLSTYFAA
eukprot:m.14029 g.14029  ORF g.14029 m.14029 type:complete len:505 (+) comp4721_c0_seq1:1601-3115(+)